MRKEGVQEGGGKRGRETVSRCNLRPSGMAGIN